MNAQLFPNLPEQRAGPIEVDGRKLVACPDCYDYMLGGTAHCRDDKDGDRCLRCNDGRVVLVRTALHRGR